MPFQVLKENKDLNKQKSTYNDHELKDSIL